LTNPILKGTIIMSNNNNNLADISVFEQLQSNQHSQTNTSQMAVFNDIGTLSKQVDEYSKRIQLSKKHWMNQIDWIGKAKH
jgi:hypothetical protein